MTIYYSEEHEWIAVEGDVATLGVTAYAAEQMGEVVFAELQDPGTTFAKGDEIGVVETVKAASEIYAPVDGEILEINSVLADESMKINEAAETDGWLYKIKITNAGQLSELMDHEAYKALIS